ncbi:MAG: acyloxyacyl hydrolase [Ectothiorhodospiraceae bacterium]|nr:acyloxyacyl hydrolase [Ectothiorhodospiraceae bacterium]
MWKASATATAVLIAKTNPLEADRMSMEIGGGDHFYVIRAGAEWDWKDNLLTVYGWNVSSYWQLDFSKWQSTRDASQSGANVTAGLTPMFRFTGSKGYVQPYFDVGVGVYLFTDSSLEDHEFGSNFQFSDLLRVGAHIGHRNQWGVGYKFQHYSNGSVREPNKGINFHFITLSYKY